MTEFALLLAGGLIGMVPGAAIIWFAFRNDVQREIMQGLGMTFVYECDRCDYRRDDYTRWSAMERDEKRHDKKHPPRLVEDIPQAMHPQNTTSYVRLRGSA